MLATVHSSTTSSPPGSLSFGDSRPAKRKRCSYSLDSGNAGDVQNGKRLQIVYTATVPLKRFKLARSLSGEDGSLAAKALVPSPSLPLNHDGNSGNMKKADLKTDDVNGITTDSSLFLVRNKKGRDKSSSSSLGADNGKEDTDGLTSCDIKEEDRVNIKNGSTGKIARKSPDKSSIAKDLSIMQSQSRGMKVKTGTLKSDGARSVSELASKPADLAKPNLYKSTSRSEIRDANNTTRSMNNGAGSGGHKNSDNCRRAVKIKTMQYREGVGISKVGAERLSLPFYVKCANVNDSVSSKSCEKTIDLNCPETNKNRTGIVHTADSVVDVATKDKTKCNRSSVVTNIEANTDKTKLNVKTISTSDLLKVLRQFNLTLKAVPLDSELANTINSVPIKVRGMLLNTEGNSTLNVMSTVGGQKDKTNQAGVLARSKGMRKLKYPTVSDTRKVVQKATSCGTFSNWKLNSNPVTQEGKESTAFQLCSKGSCAETTSRRVSRVPRRKKWTIRQQRKEPKDCVNGYTTSLSTDASSFPSSTQMKKSLDKAFHDLEARDKAARETLEESATCRTDLSLKATSEKEIGATMEGPLGEKTLVTDPILTSVACENFDHYSEELSDLWHADIKHRSCPDERQCGLEKYKTIASRDIKGEEMRLKRQCLNPENLDDSSDHWIQSSDGHTDYAKPLCKSQNVPNGVLKTRSKHEMQLDMHEYTKSKSCIVVASKNLNHSTNFDLERRKRNCCSPPASFDCPIDKRTSDNDSASKSTQVETTENEDDIGSSTLENLRSKPVETWDSDEVSVWLTSVIQNYEKDKTFNSEKVQQSLSFGPAERLNLSGTLFSRVTTGKLLRNLSLDKLRDYCGDCALAKYLFDKLQRLLSNHSQTKNRGMYKGGYCAVAGVPTVPITSAELEASVNIDDLLVSDSILGSLELTEVFDSHGGSYLKSLGPDGESRNQQFFVPSSTFHGFCNQSSILCSASCTEPADYNIRLNYKHAPAYSPPPQGEFCTDSWKTMPVAQSPDTSTVFDNSNGTCGTSFFSNNSVVYANESLPPTPIDSTTSSRPISPSTYCNLPTVGPVLLSPTKNQHEQYYHTYIVSKSWRQPTEHCHDAVNSRDSSDNDSGIYSPESSHSKFIIGKYSAANGGNILRDSTGRGCGATSPVYEGYSTPPYSSPNRRARENESRILTQMFAVPHMDNDMSKRKKVLESTDETWERASTSSTASTLSAEYETRLLNMDDCKTYIARASEQVHETGRDNNADNSMIHSTNDEAAFTPTSDGPNFPNFNGKCVIHAKRPQTITEGNITTVYPAFVTHVRRSSHASNNAVHIEAPANSFHGTYRESVDGADVIIQNCDASGRNTNGKFQIVNNDSTDGRAYDENDQAYLDSYDFKMRRTPGKSVHLWEFIRDTLLDPQYCPRLIKWEDRKAGIFRFVQSDVVAGMWGEKKNNPKMTYEKLSRAMRYYYNRGILERVDGRRLVYKFGKNAHGWRQCGENSNETKCPQQIHKPVVKQEPMRERKPSSAAKPKSAPKRKARPCKISVTMSNDVIPLVKKHRIESDKSVPNYVSVVTSQQKTAETQTPPGLNEKIAEHQKTIRNIKCEPQDDQFPDIASTAGTTSDQSPCIVYVARPEPLDCSLQDEREINIFENEAPKWSPEISVDLGKLPSADVLLGKQFRIATAAN